jgi:kynurenine formamidase
VIDLSKYRIIDLSHELVPGERKIDGTYLHGEPFHGRPVEVQEMMAFNARMHHIQSETHNGTHVEAPYKYSDDGADIASMPVESYIGEAVLCDFAHKGEGEAVTPEDLREAGVKPGDIVLLRGGEQQEEPYLTWEAIDWLIEAGIKAIGIEGVRHSPPGTPFGKEDGDGRLLLAGIAFLDGLTGLRQIQKPRVFLIALPVRMRRVTASWARAIVLEEL